MKFFVLMFVALILASLFSALFYVMKDRGNSERAVRALTVRVSLSIVVFVILMLGYHFGYISGRL
jgi:hypothetical protein